MSNLRLDKHIDRRTTHTLDRQQTWAQIGWVGHSGSVYNTTQDASKTERGGFMPLWILLEDDVPIYNGPETVR